MSKASLGIGAALIAALACVPWTLAQEGPAAPPATRPAFTEGTVAVARAEADRVRSLAIAAGADRESALSFDRAERAYGAAARAFVGHDWKRATTQYRLARDQYEAARRAAASTPVTPPVAPTTRPASRPVTTPPITTPSVRPIAPPPTRPVVRPVATRPTPPPPTPPHPVPATRPIVAPVTTRPIVPPVTTRPTPPPTTRPTTRPVTRPAFSEQTAEAARSETNRAREKAVEALRGLDLPRSFSEAERDYRDAALAQRGSEWKLATVQYRLARAQYDTARLMAPAMAKVAAARAAWKRAIDAADAALITRFLPQDFETLKKSIVLAVDLTPGDPARATRLYESAVPELDSLVAKAKAAELAERVAVARKTVENHLARRNWVKAEGAVQALEALDANAEGLADLRRRLAAVTPPKEITVSLGGGVTLRMVLIRPGRFTMGSPADEAGHDDDEQPLRAVTITRPFYLGVTEITQAQYQKVMFDNPSFYKGADRPVINVKWRDAAIFCKRLTDDGRNQGLLKMGEAYRLPTEAEFEYAARAGTKTPYFMGKTSAGLGDYAVLNRGDREGTERVKQRKPNPWGLYDIYGNAWEWCSDRYATRYPAGAAVNPTGAKTGVYRVHRGGGWRDRPDQCRSASRKPGYPTSVYDDVGFRLLKTVPGPWD